MIHELIITQYSLIFHYNIRLFFMRELVVHVANTATPLVLKLYTCSPAWLVLWQTRLLYHMLETG